MSQQQFRLSSGNTKNFMIMAVIGVVLFVGGFVLSNVTWPADKHAGGHHGAATEHSNHDAAAPHGAQPADHAAPAADHAAPAEETPAPGEQGGGDQGHNTEGHDGKNSHIMHFASEDHHEEGHGGHAHVSDHQENGTWRRAFIHEGQDAMTHHAKGEVTAGAKIGSSLLIGSYLWTAIALFGVFFIGVGYLANAGWYVPIKRVLENYYRFLPIGGILIFVTFLVFGKDIYEWVALPEGLDELIDGKRAFLNIAFFIATAVLLVSLFYPFVGHMYKKYSLAEEAQGGLAYHTKSIRLSAMFMPVFGLGFCSCVFLWLMSVDPHWFSTIYGVYCFAGLFVSGMTVTMFIVTHLKEKGHLPHFNDDHLHDMGKFMFAFSVFWAYIWISQYLLIWYANIPEETIYYWNRIQDYPVLFGLNVAINFAFPFIALMTRRAKRGPASLRGVGRVIMFGRFLDVYLLVAPAVLGAAGGFETMMMAAGATCIVGSIFLFVVFKGFEDASLEATKHPFFEESVHHSTGV